MTAVEVEGARAQIERLLLSKTFETSEAHRRLLNYLAEKSLSGEADRLKEYVVGVDAFGKPLSYDPQEDSIVRTHAGRLRLKLLEYYGLEGKDDPIAVELPKGGFKLVFRPRGENGALSVGHPVSEVSARVKPEPEANAIHRFDQAWILWMSSAILVAACLALGYWVITLRATNRSLDQAMQVPWPLSRVVDGRQPTVIIGADGGLPMLRFLTGRHITLEEYLSADFPSASVPRTITPTESKIMGTVTSATLTSYSIVQNVKTIVSLSGRMASRITVRTPREFQSRDFGDGNYILMGSPISNPWVSLFEHFLNFQEIDQMLERNQKYFLNKHPLPGELPQYQGILGAGSTGTAYATVALVPNEQHSGNVLILQGLEQEGTEEAATFLSVRECQAKLREQLIRIGADPENAWFEALIRGKSIAGTPREIDIVAVRLIR